MQDSNDSKPLAHRAHRKPLKGTSRSADSMLPLRNVLNLIFMIGALVGVVLYLCLDNRNVGIFVVLGAMVFKVVECCIRFIHR